MKKLLVTLAFAGMAAGAFALDGSLAYQNTLGVGKEKYVFGVDSAHPDVAKNGGQLSDYAGRAKLDGAGYWAELWYAAGTGKTEADLKPVAGSQVEFRTGTTAGLIKGISKLSIAGTLGGDHVTLQLRVWANNGGTVTSWADAQTKGKSNLISDFQLGGVDGTGAPVLGDGNIAGKLEYFSLAGAVIPEPSVIALGALGLGALLLRRRK